MNTTTTLSRYKQQDSSEPSEWKDTVVIEDTQNIQITQVVSCIVRPEDRPILQTREDRERLIREHIEDKS